MLLIVTSPAVYGAMLDYIDSVSKGDERLPDWSEFGSKWVRGFLVSVAGFIYFLPVTILGFVFAVPVIAAIASGSDSFAGLAAGGMCLFWVIALVYVVAVSVLFYAAIVNYAQKKSFGAFFEFSAIMGHVRDGSGYFNAWLWSIVVSFAAGIVVSILSVVPVIGSIIGIATYYLAIMITGHLFGQWAAKTYGVTQVATPVGVPGYVPPAYAAPAPPAPPAPPAAPGPAAPAPAPAAPAPAPAAPAAPPAAPAPAPAAPPVAPPAPPVAPEPPAAPPAPPAPPAAPEPPAES